MKNSILIVLLLSGGIAFSQQESQFAGAFHNPYIYNPAAGGMSGVTQIDLVARLQWVGYGQGPRTANLSGHSVLGIGNSESVQELKSGGFMPTRPNVTVGTMKHVVGGRAMIDEIGIFTRSGVYGSYAIHLPVTKEFNVGAGVGLGWGNFSINPNRVVLHDQLDDAYATALANNSQQNILDANAGIVFYGNGLFFGASMSQAFKNKAKFDNVATQSFYNRHYFLNLSYGMKVGKSVLEPGVIAKFADNSPANLDFGARFIYKNATWLGVYGRTSNNIVFQFGTTLIENLYISYAYEHSVGRIRNAASGTHEIQLGIYLGKRGPKKNGAGKENKTDSETDK